MMNPEPELFKVVSKQVGVDPALLWAFSSVESSHNPFRCRYEKDWKYPFQVIEHAKMLGQTESTEWQMQKFSWGPMQVVGSVAREMKYSDFLPLLCSWGEGLRVGGLKLVQCLKRNTSLQDAISSYNQGNPKKDAGGKYLNHEYVEKVLLAYSKSKPLFTEVL